jgi:hypothetical protein
MRSKTAILVFVVAACALAWARKEDTLEQLKARTESGSMDDKISACLEIAERQLTALDELYTAGNPDQARVALDDIVIYSEKGRDFAVESGKKLKPAEITTRKIVHKLRDIKRTLAFDDQPPVDAAVDRLEKVRTDLLAKMFAKGEK